jgi:hypothetical protein
MPNIMQLINSGRMRSAGHVAVERCTQDFPVGSLSDRDHMENIDILVG